MFDVASLSPSQFGTYIHRPRSIKPYDDSPLTSLQFPDEFSYSRPLLVKEPMGKSTTKSRHLAMLEER